MLKAQYLHPRPLIRVDLSDLVPDLLWEESSASLFLVAENAGFSNDVVFGEQVDLSQSSLFQC